MHPPDTQTAFAPQLFPHVPQCATVTPRSVSHPFVALPSQLPQPGSHAPSVQTPVVHDSAAWSRAHGTPQPPQLVRERTLVSQPSSARPLQSAQPVLHDSIWHVPVGQVATAFASVHTLPHEPQLLAVRSDVSHPSPSIMLQFCHSPTQPPVLQTPPTHIAFACARAQVRPQPPQCIRSIAGSVSQPSAVEQSRRPGMQVQTPLSQT